MVQSHAPVRGFPLRWLSGAVLLLSCAAAAGQTAAIRSVEIRLDDAQRGRVRLAPSAGAASGGRLLVAADSGPLGWLVPVAGSTDLYELEQAGRTLPTRTRLFAWLVAPTLVRETLAAWPLEATLTAQIDSLGPGAASAWLTVPDDASVGPDSSWWLRDMGQPICRFDARRIEGSLAFTRVLALVSETRLSPGLRVALWPSPRQRSEGRATSAAVFVEKRGLVQTVWIAAPAGAAAPAEARVDFYRRGRFVGNGMTERRDERFWYVRVVQSAGREPIAVGDDAVIRTAALIARRDFSARVFDVRPQAVFIDAGESEALRVGETAELYRGRLRIGEVRVAELQGAYATIEPVPPGAPLRPEVGDEVRFTPPAPPPRPVATLTEIRDETLFVASVDGPAPRLAPLAVEHDGHAVAVAFIVAQVGPRAYGFVVDASLTRPLVSGMRLVQEPAP